MESSKLQKKLAKKFDELTYYANPIINKELYPKQYSLYDKNTGLAVCFGKTKKELIEKYENVKEKYENFRKGKRYEKLIKLYNEILEKENK